jgi:hypothetical protein
MGMTIATLKQGFAKSFEAYEKHLALIDSVALDADTKLRLRSSATNMALTIATEIASKSKIADSLINLLKR